MIVEKELKAIPLPAIYKREGKECYYDTYRKKLIEITPEETVRQRVAAYFENECGVPKEMISLEVPMSYYVKDIRKWRLRRTSTNFNQLVDFGSINNL